MKALILDEKVKDFIDSKDKEMSILKALCSNNIIKNLIILDKVWTDGRMDEFTSNY